MFRRNHYARSRMFQGLEKDRSKTSMESSPAIRSHGDQPVANHPPSIVAHYPNLEMLEASQLSMDSELRANSQSSNYTDVPLGQPSASMSSSSLSAEEEIQLRSRYQNNHSSDRGGGVHTFLYQKSQSSLSGGSSIKSSFAKKKEKTKKTRFAGDTRGLIDRNATSQGSSYFTNLSSQSSPRLSEFQSGSQIQIKDPATTMHSTDGQRSSSSGTSSNNCHVQQHQFTEDSNARYDFKENLKPSNRGVENLRVLRSLDRRSRSRNPKEKRSPAVGLLNPMFSKFATPRNSMDIPYPPIKSQPRQQHTSSFRRNEGQQDYGRGFDAKNGMLKSRNGTERGCCNTEPKSDHPRRSSTINGVSKRSGDPQDFDKDEKKTSSQKNSSFLGPEVLARGIFAKQDCPENTSSKLTFESMEFSHSDTLSLNSEEKIQPNYRSKASENENIIARNENMEDLKTSLQKLMSNMESEAKAKFEKVSQTITSATESNLDKKAKAFQEEMKVKLDEKANTIKETTQSNLDLLDQKQREAEKGIETLRKSTTTKLEETASASVRKLEACTESGLTKLKKFTETWLANSYKSIANRLKPYLRISSETVNTKIGNGNVGGFATSTDVREHKNKSRPVLNSKDKNQLKRKLSTLTLHSPEKDQIETFSSSMEGETSLTQDSESSSRKNSVDKGTVRPLRRSKRTKQSKNQNGDTIMNGNTNMTTPTSDDKVPVRPLRRSKRTKQSHNKAGDTNLHENVNMTTPTTDKKKRTKSPTRSNNREKKPLKNTESALPLAVAISDKVLCVTPTEGNSQSLKKTAKPNHTLKQSKIGTNRLKPLRSKRRKKRKTPPNRPLIKKRSESQSVGSQRSVPTEILAYDDFQLSPLEVPNLFAFPKTKQHPNLTMYGSRSASKPFQSFKKGKTKTGTGTSSSSSSSGTRRTYGRRKNTFDVMDNDVFRF